MKPSSSSCSPPKTKEISQYNKEAAAVILFLVLAFLLFVTRSYTVFTFVKIMMFTYIGIAVVLLVIVGFKVMFNWLKENKLLPKL